MKSICIFGAGGFAKEVKLICDRLGYSIAYFIDLIEKDSIEGVPVVKIEMFNPSKHLAVVGIGNPEHRKKIVDRLNPNTEFATIIDPTVIMSKSVKFGPGAVICAGSILTVDIDLGKHAQINLATTIGHDVKAGDYFTTAPQVAVSGKCKFGDRVYLGTGSKIIENIEVTDGVTLGAGAVLVKSVVIPGVYKGVPAKYSQRMAAIEE